MPKRSTLLSLAILLLVIAGVVIAVLLQQQKAELDASSESFAIETSLAILEGLSQLEATDDGPPPTLTPVTSASIWMANLDSRVAQYRTTESLENELNSVYHIMGNLISMDSIVGESTPAIPLVGPELSTASYSLGVSFSRGPATVVIVLEHDDSRWWITDFEIASVELDS